MTVEDMVTGNVYTFELHEELIRNSECDGWKEIPVRVDRTAASVQQTADDDDEKRNDDVSDADAATAVASAQPEPQLSCNFLSPHYSSFVLLLVCLYMNVSNQKNETLSAANVTCYVYKICGMLFLKLLENS